MISSQSLGSIGPLIEMNQMLTLILILNNGLPDNAMHIYNMINLVSNINLNFSFTQPLSFIKNRNLFGKVAYTYNKFGYEVRSFIYNTQSMLLSYFVLFLIFKLVCKIEQRLQDKPYWLSQKIRAILLTFTNGFLSIIMEMYFQQRIMIYFAFYLFIINFNSVAISFIENLVLTLDCFAIVVFILVDAIYTQKYISAFTNDEDYQPIVSIQSELVKGKQNMGVVQFQLDCLIMHIMCPLIAISQISIVFALNLMAFVFLHMGLLILISNGVRYNKKMMICYLSNYLVLIMFCGLLCSCNYMHNERKINIIGWILGGLIVIPTLLTGIFYIPEMIINLKSTICGILQKYKKWKMKRNRGVK